MRYKFVFFLSFIFLDCCVEPLKIDLGKANFQLVVDGLITDEKGPYQVKLFYSTELDHTVRTPLVESAASVWIISDDNEVEELQQTVPGVYETNVTGIQGQIGKSYKLKITTAQGKSYETKFQRLKSSGTIDSIYVDFESQSLSTIGTDLNDAIKLLINATGVQDESNSLRWRWTSVYKAKTFPELRKEYEGTILVPAPEPCSGYVRNGMGISKRGECTCCICWSTQYSNNVIISDDSYVNDARYKNVNIGKFIINSMFFYDRLYIEVEQLNMADDTYDFWKLVALQERVVGNLFQPNAVKIKGNVYSTSDSNDEVLGVFGVSSIIRKNIFVDRSIVPYALSPIDTIGYDCRTIFSNASTEKPSFW